MIYNDLSSKLAQVIEQIPKDVLYDFCCSYAQEYEELDMELVIKWEDDDNFTISILYVRTATGGCHASAAKAAYVAYC